MTRMYLCTSPGLACGIDLLHTHTQNVLCPITVLAKRDLDGPSRLEHNRVCNSGNYKEIFPLTWLMLVIVKKGDMQRNYSIEYLLLKLVMVCDMIYNFKVFCIIRNQKSWWNYQSVWFVYAEETQNLYINISINI